jgi:hypothetical protein
LTFDRPWDKRATLLGVRLATVGDVGGVSGRNESLLTTFEEAGMRKFLVTAVFAVALLGMLSPPVFAQAPAPNVKITGLFDQVTAAGGNLFDGNYARTGDKEWYARTRFRPDFSFEVGRTKAVFGLEIDLVYGQMSNVKAGASAAGFLDINTDTAGVIEVKWMYTEFDLTGKDSLMPFIPVPTVARAGGQPFSSLANYKVTYANGDFAGLSAVTTFAPNLKTNVAWVIVEDESPTVQAGTGARSTTPGLGNDMAWIFSADYTVYKGLDIKPVYSYFHAEGTTSGSARRGVADNNIAGGTTSGASAFLSRGEENRHTLGVDAQWRMGPYGLDPTILYQWGKRDVLAAAGGKVETDVSSWLIDLVGSYYVGPLLLEVRGIYSPGNEAKDNLARKIRYFEPLDTDTSYYAGWASILALGVDYFNGGGQMNNQMATNVGYDRYGRAQLGFRATYSMTPALAFYGVLSPTWTAEKVDTDTNQGASARTAPAAGAKGESAYIGTEADIGLTWKFAPNTAFDLSGAWLFAGNALDTTETLNGVATKRDAKDAWTVASRIRLSF